MLSLSTFDIRLFFKAISKNVFMISSFIVTPIGYIVEVANPWSVFSNMKGLMSLSGNLKCLIFLQVKSAVFLLSKSCFQIYCPEIFGVAYISSNLSLISKGISSSSIIKVEEL